MPLASAAGRAQDQTKFVVNFRAVRKTEFFNRIGRLATVNLESIRLQLYRQKLPVAEIRLQFQAETQYSSHAAL